MSLLEDLNWRYATKKFDPTKKVSDQHLEELKIAIQLAPTSYGLQAFKVFLVENPETRNKLKQESWGQSQITDASHLFVFCGNTKISNELINEYVNLISAVREIPVDKLEGYGDFMKSKLVDMTTEEAAVWTSKQTYIALGNLLTACATLKIDSCPIEGFEPEAYDEILGLKDQGLTSTVVVAVGYRSEDDATQHGKKVRKPITALFVHK